MGANKNSVRQRCGDILINVKTIKNKAKTFIFHCALCSIECDQLKKFAKHLENHLNYFENVDEQVKDESLFFEPEKIKDKDMELFDKGFCNIVSFTSTTEEYEDPLETEKFAKSDLENPCNTDLMMSNMDIKNETEDDNENCDKTGCEMECAVSVDVAVFEESTKNKHTHSLIIHNDFSSEDFSDYSSDSDYEVEKEFTTSKNVERTRDTKNNLADLTTKKKSAKGTNKSYPNKGLYNNKPKKRRKVIVEAILPILIEQYKKHKVLWQVDDIAFGVKNKKYEIYARIAEVLKLEADEIIGLESINYHINYLNELYSKDKELELKCIMEKKEFFPVYKHYKKMSFLSCSQGPFLCGICNEILPKYHHYCQHMAEHNNTQPFKCPSCDMTFNNYHKYLIHKKRHLGIYDFHCNICGKGYLFKNDLEWHITSHTGDKPYLCQICGTGFRARHGYDNHIRRHEERFRHECHICKKGFNQLHALNNHVKSHLNIRDVICQICGKGFVHSKYLKRHELIHGKEKRYKCNECGKAFFQACGLRAHRKNHHS